MTEATVEPTNKVHPRNTLLNRWVILISWLFFSLASFFWAVYKTDGDLFAASGAIGTTLGLLLNIKYGLLTYSSMTDKELYDHKTGVFGLSSVTLSEEQRKELRIMVSDEKIGIFLMVLGTLIWAYGSYLVPTNCA